MIDIHCHVLPGVDDGAKNLDMALAMLNIAAQDGIRTIIATPHVIDGSLAWKEIQQACHKLQKAAKEEKIPVQLLPGAELAMNWDLLELLKAPGCYGLAGSRYVLVELPAMSIPRYADDFFFTLQARGFSPVLAHPERHPELQKNPDQLEEWVNRGIALQVNALSLSGKMGEKAASLSRSLVQSGMAHALASDAHSTGTRRPQIREAARIHTISDELSQAIVADEPWEPATARLLPSDQRKSRPWWQRLLRRA